MKLGIAQIKPIKGDITENIKNHIHWIQQASLLKADTLFFPELSITGYEPSLAYELGTNMFDKRLDIFQELSNQYKMIIGIGIPFRENNIVKISMVIFQANLDRRIYSKQYLYHTEEAFFKSGDQHAFIQLENDIISPAICFELSIENHSKTAIESNTNLYVASVCNSVEGVDKDLGILSEIAKKYKVHTFMSNYIGKSGGYNCAGKSSIWDINGEIIHQMDSTSEGIIVFDTQNKSLQTS